MILKNAVYAGKGLGLAKARRIIEAHRGTIQASYGKDRGMCFTMRLPLMPDPDLTANGRP